MKNLIISLLLIICTSSFTFAASFVVNNNGDTIDINPGNNICADSSGNCTLRAAIQQANGSPGDDTITFALATPATINLTLTTAFPASLSIFSNITIIGLGARNLTVNGNFTQVNGTFNIGSSTVNISGITISNAPRCSIDNSGQLTLSEVILKNNGTGICNNSALNLSNSTISNNLGGVYNSGFLNISNTTISYNTGGGIANSGNGTLTNVTISNNTATEIGGGLHQYNQGSVLSVRNTIIANNSSPIGPDIFGLAISLGNNLIGKGDGGINGGSGGIIYGFTNGVNGDKVGTSANPIDPLLGALQNNGGQTDTRALLTGSPAIDMGNNCVFTATCLSNNPIQPLTTDQRGLGFSRLVGSAVDMGAFEVQPICTPFTTVSEGDLFAGGIVSFGVSSGQGSVTIDHVNAGTGTQSLTVVGTPTNAVVNIPAFTPGTFAPIVVTFTTPNPTLPTDFTLRAASTFHAANIRVRCIP